MKKMISDSYTLNEKQAYFKSGFEQYNEKYNDGVEKVLDKYIKDKIQIEKDDKQDILVFLVMLFIPLLFSKDIIGNKSYYMHHGMFFFVGLWHILLGITFVLNPTSRQIFYDGFKKIFALRFKKLLFHQIFIIQQTLLLFFWAYIYLFYIDWDFSNKGVIRIGAIIISLFFIFGFRFIKMIFSYLILCFLEERLILPTTKLLSPTLEGETFSEAISLLGFKMENLTYKPETGTIINEDYQELATYPAGIAFYTKQKVKKKVKFVLYFERFKVPALSQIENNEIDMNELKCSGIYYADRRKKASDEIGSPIPRVIPEKDYKYWLNEDVIDWCNK